MANVFLTDNFYLRAGIYNASSCDTCSTVSNLFDNWETFQHIELGWSGNPRRPASLVGASVTDTDNFHVVFWHKDNQAAANVAESKGVAFNANFQLNENVMPFLRGGMSDGNATLVDRNISFGLGMRPFDKQADLFGVAAGWARPSNNALEDQLTIETFYRYQLTDTLAITPNIQLIMNPALDPSIDKLWAVGLRVRATF